MQLLRSPSPHVVPAGHSETRRRARASVVVVHPTTLNPDRARVCPAESIPASPWPAGYDAPMTTQLEWSQSCASVTFQTQQLPASMLTSDHHSSDPLSSSRQSMRHCARLSTERARRGRSMCVGKSRLVGLAGRALMILTGSFSFVIRRELGPRGFDGPV